MNNRNKRLMDRTRRALASLLSWTAGSALVCGCSTGKDPQPERDDNVTAEIMQEVGVPDLNAIRKFEHADDALHYSLSFVSDHYPPPNPYDTWEEPSRLAFTCWALDHLQWRDLEPVNSAVRAADVAASPGDYLGERACFDVAVIVWNDAFEVEPLRVVAEEEDGRLIGAILVGEVSHLRDPSVRVCGFVMGRFGRPEFDSDAGVSMVGMIDTPTNRFRKGGK